MAKYDGLFEYLIMGALDEGIRLLQPWIPAIAVAVTVVVVVAFIATAPTGTDTKVQPDTD